MPAKLVLMLLLCVGTALCLPPSSRGQEGVTPALERDDLIGLVKTVSSYNARLVLRQGHWVEADRELKHTATYDSRGNALEVLMFSLESLTLREIYTYDANRRLQTKTAYSADGTIKFKKEFYYDANGYLKEVRARGERFGGGTRSECVTYTFDRQGKLVEINYHEEPEGLIKQQRLVYAPDGTLSAVLLYGPRGERRQRHAFLRDGRGRLLSQATFRAHDVRPQSETTYLYDSGTARLVFVESSSRNDQFEITSRVLFDQYKYDEQGNWTRRRLSISDTETGGLLTARSVEHRIITYH